MKRVVAAMKAQGLSLRTAAAAIGVGSPTLEKHIAGEHVRSDSALKYRNWLEGRKVPQNVFVLTPPELRLRELTAEADHQPTLPAAPSNPRLVVDIFSGCGGLSLGFDLLGGGDYFKTILAIDNQAAPIEVLNRNSRLLGHAGLPVGRQIDLTEFTSEAEFLTFYVEHVSEITNDPDVLDQLQNLVDGAFPKFRTAIDEADSAYLYELNASRASRAWQIACEGLDKQCLSQTSVIGFHDQLRLPRTSTRTATLPAVLWGDTSIAPSPAKFEPPSHLLREAEDAWDTAVERIAAQQKSSGRGQLSASARRVSSFVALLRSPAMKPIRATWTRWQARRLDLRASIFDDPDFAAKIRELYSKSYPVSVLVGGPPCQGFSRIGRGKIRSLREALVHVQQDSEAGDARNLLFRQYVMVLEALRPDIFLFENVQHFQSTVRADGAEFQATEVLAEAIANLSQGEVAYGVSSRVIDASRHGVPQTRQRYFMCGVRKGGKVTGTESVANQILALRQHPEVPLSEALAGLPQPDMVGGGAVREFGRGKFNVSPAHDAGHAFSSWIARPPSGRKPIEQVDAHIARTARADDAAFFALMGPGKRWMDYRADSAPTIAVLRELMEALCSLPPNVLTAARQAARRNGHELLQVDELVELKNQMNGSLTLRLLLEQVSEKLGMPHHLLTETYLSKRDGHHGDWVARMDATRPAKTMVSHMGKDTYGYVHPHEARTISVREAARIQTFPDWFSFDEVALTDAFKMVGNAVPPLLSNFIATNVSRALAEKDHVLSRSSGKRKLVTT